MDFLLTLLRQNNLDCGIAGQESIGDCLFTGHVHDRVSLADGGRRLLFCYKRVDDRLDVLGAQFLELPLAYVRDDMPHDGGFIARTRGLLLEGKAVDLLPFMQPRGDSQFLWSNIFIHLNGLQSRL